MRKRIATGLLACFCLLALGVSDVAADVLLGVPLRAQEHDQWCWAGSSNAVLAYYGTSISQCAEVNWAFQRTDCCGNATFGWSNTCNYWNYMWGGAAVGSNANGSLQGIMTHWGVNSSVVSSALTKTTSVAEIDAGRPFVIRFGWTSGGGHFLDGYGYDQSGDYLDYMDPWPGNGFTKSLYSWTVSASDHAWTHTLKITTNPPISKQAVTVTVPNGGQRWKRSTRHRITWTRTVQGGTVTIKLMRGAVTYKTITKTAANTGTYAWTIPATLLAGSKYKIKIISNTTPTAFDQSNNFFTIY